MNEPMRTPDEQKRAAARTAVAEIESGMIVGLGSGTTAAHAIAELGARFSAGLSVRAVPTSLGAAAAAERAGIPLLDLSAHATVDLAIDGVDEIDPAFRAIKGGGGAMVCEKVVASAATRMIAIADASKAVPMLGAVPLPVEVLPFATGFVMRSLAALGIQPRLRHTGGGARWITDQGNVVLDCRGAPFSELAALAVAIDAVPGVIGHGLFLSEIDALYIASPDGTVARRERLAPYRRDADPGKAVKP